MSNLANAHPHDILSADRAPYGVEYKTATVGFTNFNLPYTASKSNYFLDVSYRFGK